MVKIEDKYYYPLFKVPIKVVNKVYYIVYMVAQSDERGIYRLITDDKGMYDVPKTWANYYGNMPQIALALQNREVLQRIANKKKIREARNIVIRDRKYFYNTVKLRNSIFTRYLFGVILDDDKKPYKVEDFNEIPVYVSAQKYFSFLPPFFSALTDINYVFVKNTMESLWRDAKTEDDMKFVTIMQKHFKDMFNIYKAIEPLTFTEKNLMRSFKFSVLLKGRNALCDKAKKKDNVFVWPKDYTEKIFKEVLYLYEKKTGHPLFISAVFTYESDFKEEKAFLTFIEYLLTRLDYRDPLCTDRKPIKGIFSDVDDYYISKYGEEGYNKLINNFNKNQLAYGDDDFFYYKMYFLNYYFIRRIPIKDRLEDSEEGEFVIREYPVNSFGVNLANLEKTKVYGKKELIVKSEPLFRGIEL